MLIDNVMRMGKLVFFYWLCFSVYCAERLFHQFGQCAKR